MSRWEMGRKIYSVLSIQAIMCVSCIRWVNYTYVTSISSVFPPYFTFTPRKCRSWKQCRQKKWGLVGRMSSVTVILSVWEKGSRNWGGSAWRQWSPSPKWRGRRIPLLGSSIMNFLPLLGDSEQIRSVLISLYDVQKSKKKAIIIYLFK